MHPGYAVLDFETTGLGDWDQIIEFGVVLLDENFAVQGELGSLVAYPGRIKNAWAHGIDDAQLIGAPTLAEAFTWLQNAVAGRIMVAHNAPFDRRFLMNAAEKHLPGYRKTEPKPRWVDTKYFGKELLGTLKLTSITAKLGIEHSDAHNALADARATAEFLQYAATAAPKSVASQVAQANPWPHATLVTIGELKSRESNHEIFRERSAWLRNLELPESGSDAEAVETYSKLLERYAYNFDLSAAEKYSLGVTASALGLSLQQVAELHRKALSSACSVAFPEALKPQREFWLTRFAHQLGFSTLESFSSGSPSLVRLPQEWTIFLSGRLNMRQDDWERRLTRGGYSLAETIETAHTLVVARRAVVTKPVLRALELGIPVIEESAFSLYV